MDVGEPRAELKGLQETRKGLRGQGRSERQPEALYRAFFLSLNKSELGSRGTEKENEWSTHPYAVVP